MLNTILKKIFGTKHERDVKRIAPVVDRIGSYEEGYASLSSVELAGLTPKFRDRLENGESLDDLLPEAFAAVREASRRSIGLRHFDVQMMGGIVLHEGRIAEMKTGEGKTLVATLAVYLNALSGKGVHVITVNDYLARRDAEWMGPIYSALGVSFGVIQSNMETEPRRAAYACDITYGTNIEFGFDYLRDNMVPFKEYRVQRGHNFAIVDEVDSILIDEARTPLIISGQAEESTQLYREMDKLAASLKEGQDYELDEKDRAVNLTESGVHRVESMINVGNLYEPQNMHLVHHVTEALRARKLYRIDVDYVVQDGEVIIVDEFTGRLMPGRRWSGGLHQAIEAKEKLNIKRESLTLATITFQNYFKMYEKLAGMTGTADTEANEFLRIYELDVVVLPTNRPMIRFDDGDVVYKTEREKFNAVIEDINEAHERGQPVLVGTISIEKSEKLSEILKKRGIPHHVLNAKHHDREAEIVAQAGRLKSVTIATNMAGRGTDIMLGGNPEFLARQRTPKNEPEAFERLIGTAREECRIEHDQVVELGGLHIVGTERHESRRIDNQLRGRSGRQGDPGSTRFYLSLEDDLMRMFGGERVTKVMDILKWEEGEPIVAGMVTKAIARAQERVEGVNFERRKRLLDYDNVMNQQREVIYGLREMALSGDELEPYLLEAAEESLDSVLAVDLPERTGVKDWDVKHLMEYLRRQYNFMLPENVIEGDGMTRESLREILWSEISGRFENRKAEFGPDLFRDLCRQAMLLQVDHKWREHLSAMDALREGIGWRGMGGNDPLVEYKREAFGFFSELIASVREEIVSFAYHVRPLPAGSRPAPRPSLPISSPVSSATPSSPENSETVRAMTSPARGDIKTRKVGRNDPCPCGSGKKYKKCCGA